MPKMYNLRNEDLTNTLQTIGERVYTRIGELTIAAWMTEEPVPWPERESGSHNMLRIGDSWGGLFDSAWFRFTGQISAEGAGKHVVLLLDVNGEMCIVNTDGHPVRGLTNKTSTFNLSLGKPGKWVYDLTNNAKAGEQIDIWADAGCNDLFGRLQGGGRIVDAHIAVCRDDLKALYYDFEVLYDWVQHGSPDSARCRRIKAVLYQAAFCLKTFSEREVIEARSMLATVLDTPSSDTTLSISATGHAHLDLGWLWPIRETKRKGARTFATALAMIDTYPGYIFGASQYQLFQWMKTDYPELYQRIKQAVEQGSIEPQGCVWVEADLNCSGGEALVRQILYGMQFLREEFGRTTTYLWEPDVFGFTGALPQLLKKSGIQFLATQKLSWNMINAYPHESFVWKGIDGSDVLVHFFPEKTYNGPAAPRSALKIAADYKDRDVSSHALMVFGIGDGGGGPGEEHLERLMRIQDVEGLPKINFSSTADFFEQWAQEADQFETWSGELYLERHQGTLTTQAWSKRFNRKMELALREAEWLATLVSQQCGEAYPQPELEEIWKEVLLYQFHDILPGSSIRRVYEESEARYRILLDSTEKLITQRERALEQQIDTSGFKKPVLALNSLSWDRQEWLHTEDGWVAAEIPAMGYAVVEAANNSHDAGELTAQDRLLENNRLRAEFAEDGRLTSLYEKATGEEYIRPGAQANDLSIYEDNGDAWGDMDLVYATYRQKRPDCFELVSVSATVDGPKAVLRQEYRYNTSSLRVDIILMQNSGRLDFVCSLDWREPQKMLRTGFPVDMMATEATCEIQFGAIKRPTHSNTTWDMAKDEVAANKWIDISDAAHGLALLNDCKYGHRVKDNVLEIALVRSAPYPGPQVVEPDDSEYACKQFTDLTQHEFTYALYPHAGRYEQGGVVRQGYELNVPIRVVNTGIHDGDLPAEHALLTLDNQAIVIEAVKMAEDADGIIVRLYETSGGKQHAHLWSGLPIRHAALVNLLEEKSEDAPIVDQGIALTFGPYEIHTVRLQHELA